ncbi:MAG TPA: DUF4350 domain-containing protein [Candidatus Dormibacteraeota bacterium]|nr:DUF4350 domain-containing protein [Candidatus Dormibacteraeota bacterium]
MLRSRLQAGMLLALLGVLGLGVARLLALRAAQGDVYARYSTLRSDPFGARILMEGLREIDGLRVRRNTAPLSHLWEDPDETLFLLGASPLHLDSDASDDDLEIEALVRQGARAVIAVAPVGDAKSAKEDETDKTRLEPPADDDPVLDQPRRQTFNRILGFKVEHAPLPEDEDHEPVADVARRASGPSVAPDLPETLPWHTTLCFTDLAADWRVIYVRAGRPVLIERHLGRGSLVLSADSFVLSNESLSRDPKGPLVSWLVGTNRTVVFDETHLGVVDRQGVASLMRRYGLHGSVAAILLAAVLFVWRASVPFLPPREEKDAGTGEAVTGRDAAAGLVTILRRGIPASDVMSVCRTVWNRTFQRRRPDLVAALERMTEEAADPVEGYRRISRTLQEMKVTYER